jgi:MacB-like periplasmic core domain
MEKLLHDIRYGTRSILKSPRFTIAAVLTLALGIGANTAMFSVIRAVLMRSWPFPDPGRLMQVLQRQADGNNNLFSTRDFLDWKQQGGLLARMGAHVSWQFNISSPGEPPERIAGGVVSSDFLPVLGTKPLLGRFFSGQEDQPGGGQFVILSHAFWANRFGADRDIVGKPVQIDGVPYSVIGVMPAGFNGLDGKELLWTPLQLRRDSGTGASPNVHWLTGIIRLPDGLGLKQASSELEAAAARLHRKTRVPTLASEFSFRLSTTLSQAGCGRRCSC